VDIQSLKGIKGDRGSIGLPGPPGRHVYVSTNDSMQVRTFNGRFYRVQTICP